MFDKSNRRLFLLALALAIICAGVAYFYLQQLEAKAVATPTETVVIVNQQVGSREPLNEGMVTEKQIPVDAIHPNALRSLTETKGKITTMPLVAGEQLLSDKLSPGAQDSPLAYNIPSDMRAVTVGVDERIATALLLQPGDRVDVAASYVDNSNQKTVKIILQDIAVLALGQRTVEKNTPDSPQTVNTATLAVSPSEAEELIWAEEFGRIRFLLRHVTDRNQPYTPGVNTNTIN